MITIHTTASLLHINFIENSQTTPHFQPTEAYTNDQTLYFDFPNALASNTSSALFSSNLQLWYFGVVVFYQNQFFNILIGLAKKKTKQIQVVEIDQQQDFQNLRIFEMRQESKDQIVQPLITETSKGPQNASPPAQERKLPPSPFFSLFAYTTPAERITLILGSIAALISGGTFPFFLIYFADITTIFDERNRSHAMEAGWELCWKFLLIGGVIWVSHFFANYFWNSVGSAQSVRLKKLYYKTLLEQEVQWFDENDPHKIVTKVATSITAIETATGEKISLMISTTITGIGGMFFAFFKCWQLSLMLLATLPAMLLGGMFFMKALIMYSQREKTSYEMAASRTEQALGQIRTVKGLHGEDYQMKKFQEALNEGTTKSLKYNFNQAFGQALIIFIFLSIYAFGFWYGKKLIIDNIDTGKYNVADILSTFFCFIVGGSSIGQISPFFKNIAEGRVSMAQLLNLLNRKKTLVEPEDGIKIKTIKKIKLRNISFSNKKDQPVLKNINITFSQGKVSALVGQSGCGKSTIVQLLLRYYDVQEGGIFINGNKISDVNMNNYRRKIGFVGQEPVLFAMSIAENLRLADPTLSDEEMIEALKKANAWEFVEKTEKRLDTYVGSGGTQLSGGQKQRIAIARALCKKPQILILDEATSALDRKNQREIQQTLKNLEANGITTIVIAHRLSTIRDADCIYVLNKGVLSESGKHDHLINKGGLYAQLVETQLAADKHIGQGQSINRYSEIEAESQVQEIAQEKKEEVAQPPKEKQDAVFGKLLKFQWANIHLLIIGALGALGAGMVWPLFNYFFSGILQLMMNPVENNDQLNFYCLIFEIVAVTSGSMTFLYTFSFGLSRERLVYNIRMRMFDKLLRLPVSFYDQKQNTAGAISIKLATDAFQLNNMVSGVLGVMCLNTATICTSLVFGLYYSWKVTLIALALSPLIAVVGSINMKVVLKFTSMSQETEKFLGSLMSDSVCNIRTVKSLGRPKAFLQKFDEKLDQLNTVNSQKHLKSAILSGMSKGMIMFVEGIIFFIAAILFQNSEVDSGRAVFTAVFSVIFAAMGVGQNSQFMPDMAKAKLAGTGIFDILDSKDEKELSFEAGGSTTDKLEGSIEFKNVSFRYPQREKLVLENLSFKIQGQKIALVGHSGSGKSTVVQLLMRFYDPEEGEILINNKNVKEFDLYSLRKQIGLVSQQPALFMGSVFENIRYNSDCTQEEIQQATEIANAKKFITEWDQGFQKQVGQKGSQVSGGQKQRIALSRCLVKNPSLYLFDEFTSALDADTEKAVFENLKPVLKGKTSISIAHRLSTVQDSDRILVFKDGKIIEEGSYSQLMSLRSHFFKLSQ